MFATQLEKVQRITPDRFAEYGVDASTLDGIKCRFTQWAAELLAEVTAATEPAEMVRKFANLDQQPRTSDPSKRPIFTSRPSGYGRMNRTRDDGPGR